MVKVPTLAIIEDNQDLREELEFFLESKGYRHWFASNAEEFWKKLHLNKADIFIIDIGLPGEDGFSLIKHLSQLGDFGLIIMTARGGKQDYTRGLNLGADHYLVKPINFVELNNILVSLWDRLQLNITDTSTEVRQPEINSEVKTEKKWFLDKINFQLVAPNEQTLKLSQQEKELLNTLMKQPNQIVSRALISQSLFNHLDNEDFHRIDVIVSRLRKKAKEKEFDLPLRSIFGKGLVLVTDE